VPNAPSTRNTVRIPGAASGPSQPTSCGSPRHDREAAVTENARAPPVATVAPVTTAAAGEASATIAAASAGAVITDISKTIETIA
jgi:hypothetical protein